MAENRLLCAICDRLLADDHSSALMFTAIDIPDRHYCSWACADKREVSDG